MKSWGAMWVTTICALAAALGPSLAAGQTWPQRPVRVITPFVAGGNTDSQARIVSERLSAVLGQPFVVENRVGAGGAIAAEFVAKAPADGYTLFFAASPLLSLPLIQKVNYDPFRDFTPISIVGIAPFVMGVHISVPAKTVKEFVDYVKTRPGQMNYSSGGTGTGSHLSAALFLARAGLRMQHIPYKGGAQSIADLVGGQVHMSFGNASELIQHSKSGKVRMLAVSTDKRSAQLPDVPAVAETYAGFRTYSWNGYLVPAAAPKPIIERIGQEVMKIVREPATAERLNNIGVEPLGNTPAEFAEFMRQDAAVWRDAVNAAGIKLD
ncbi:MAG: tripartite tricarboxylate transporter substrate binding protein [Betaproteobacteria bacterium]|nr:tripartite tricarboxylate transporter substrate binding protein [Betaproteobacteria bacterium]